jgi:hypothetical protein
MFILEREVKVGHYHSSLRGDLIAALLLGALSACSGNTSRDAAGGSAGMTAAGGSPGGANSGGARNSGGAGGNANGGAVGNATGGAVGNAGGGAGSVDLSSDPGNGTCTNFTPCGGDVLGAWRVESLCFESLSLNFPNCPQATASISITGSLTFSSDGTYVARGTTMSRTTLPQACAALCNSSCTTASDGGCVCDATTPIQDTPLAYSVDGNKLIVHQQMTGDQTAYFCRIGDQILMRGYSSAATRYQYDLRRTP